MLSRLKVEPVMSVCGLLSREGIASVFAVLREPDRKPPLARLEWLLSLGVWVAKSGSQIEVVLRFARICAFPTMF